MTAKLIQALRRSELFSELGDEELQRIAAPARLVRLSRGAHLFFEGDPRAYVYQLRSGRLKITRMCADGRELILDLIGSGQIFGETSVLDEDPHDSSAEALEHSEVWAIPKAPIARLLRSNPDLVLKVVRTIGIQKKKLESRLENFAFKKVPGRLATVLLQLGKEYGVPDCRGTLLPIRLSHEQLGNLIGASREIVCVTLSSFRRRGLIDQQGRQLIIRQHQPLAQLH